MLYVYYLERSLEREINEEISAKKTKKYCKRIRPDVFHEKAKEKTEYEVEKLKKSQAYRSYQINQVNANHFYGRTMEDVS